MGRAVVVVRRIALAALVVLTALAGAPASAQTLPVNPDITYEVLSTNTQDPLVIQVASDGRIIWIEREGGLNVLNPDGTQVEAAKLPVSANACNDCAVQDTPVALEEGGLHGLLLAKDFDETGRLYLFYSVVGSRNPDTKFGTYRLSTFVLDDANVLHLDSEQKILDVPVEWDHCCHYGGNLEWLPDGTILLSTGDDVPASSSNGYGPRDARNAWLNAELSSGNPADRRGKILRLMPDGSVPDGSQSGIAPNPFLGKSERNPYIPDTSGDPTDGLIDYDPYVYSTGYKQPFRGAVHEPTGTFYLGDVGPDAYFPDPAKGPRGQEELNVVPPGGGVNHGWPRCIADNQPYHDYDYTTSTDKGPLDCSKMTGAVLWYPHDVSERWPQLGAGGVTSIPSTVYSKTTTGALRLPARFNDKLFVLEFSRDFIATIPVRDDGSLDVSQPAVQMVTPIFKPLNAANPTDVQPTALLNPIDSTIGPDGALYFLEYGAGFYNNALSRVSRIKCAGCTPNPSDYGRPDGARVDYGVATDTAGVVPAQPLRGTAPRALLALTVGVLAVAGWRRRQGAVA